MKVPISLQDFNALVAQDWFNKPLYYRVTKEYYSDLYNTGCRPTEPFLIDRWNIAGDNVLLTPLKGNNQRVIASNLISNSLYEAISQSKAPYNGISLHQMRLQFKRQFPLPQLFHESKPIDFYAFRYFKAKQLQSDGKSNREIQSHFGWTNSALVQVYTGAAIYYTQA